MKVTFPNGSTLEEMEDVWFGKRGTKKRYLWDREFLKDYIVDTFVTFLVYPLRLLPFGHVAEAFWYRLIREGRYGTLDGLAFNYFDDAYVVPLRAGLRGKKHHWHHGLHEDNWLRPYPFGLSGLKIPYWLITRIVFPRFIDVYRQYEENR